MASLYASIERKRRELAVLRLIGLSRTCLIRFPVYQSLLLATGSYFVAAGVFHGIAITINHFFVVNSTTARVFAGCQPLIK